MCERETQFGLEELLDVWAADIIGLFELNDTDDLYKVVKIYISSFILTKQSHQKHIHG